MVEVPTTASARFGFHADVQVTTRKNFNRVESDLAPIQTVALSIDKVPTYRGRGRYTPYWARCTPVLSSTGEYVDAARPSPGDISPGSDIQWIALDSTMDENGVWVPWRSLAGSYSWLAEDAFAHPIMETISYRIGREIITVPRMRFTGQNYLVSSFGTGLDDAVAWTISMAVMLQAPVNKYPLLDWGVPEYVAQDPAETRTYIHVSDVLDYGWGSASGTVDPVVPVSRYQPCYITLTVNAPLARLVFSGGTDYSLSSVIGQGDSSSATELQFWIGRSIDVAESPNFSVLEVNFWGRTLDNSEIVSLNGYYASIYGATSEQS